MQPATAMQRPSPPDDTSAKPEPSKQPLRPELSYFADGELKFQHSFRSLRDRLLRPLSVACLKVGITADVVSGLAAAMLVPFGVLLFSDAGWAPPAAAFCLLLHVLLDGLDGPLARLAGTDGPAGAFTDMCLDHAGYLAVTTLLAFSALVDGAAACLYASTYTLSVALIVVLNMLQRPLRIAIRTKYVFYALYVLLALTGLNLLTPAALTFSAVHLVLSAIAFIAVRQALSERTHPPVA
jgi:phosphatidylglycerophosphate synthase